MAKAKDEPLSLDERKALAGVLALLVEEREAHADDKHEARKTEVILSDAGLSAPEISKLMGKNEGAVAKAITRARTARKKPKRGR